MPEDAVAIIGLVNDQVETVKEELSEAVAEVELKTENQENNLEWIENRISQMERNQAELLEKMDSLALQLMNPVQPTQNLLEEVEDDLKAPEETPAQAPAQNPFLIF
jgi:predicted nuclease with TOPRIM domain